MGRDFSPMKSELSKKLIHLVTDFKLTKPDINPFFKWIDTKYVDSSIWKEIIKYELWNLIDDRNIKRMICDYFGVSFLNIDMNYFTRGT